MVATQTRDTLTGTKLQDAKSHTNDTAENVNAVKEDVESMISQANDEMRELADTVKKYGSEFAHDRKLGTADTISDIADSLRQTATSLSNSPNVRDIVSRAADNLEGISVKLRNKSFTDFYRDAEDFARERPFAVAAGAAIVGLLAARLLKSSSERHNR